MTYPDDRGHRVRRQPRIARQRPPRAGAVDADELFGTCNAIAILRGFAPGEAVQLAHRAWDVGIDLVEVTVQTPDAMSSMAAVVAEGRDQGRRVGAGTVITVEQVQAVADLGAVFTVAPGLDADVVAAARDRGLVHLPGVATSTEVQQALGLGLSWLKAFPASVLGVGWFRAMQGPFPQVRFVATGGINAANGREFLAAGARMVAVGSALADPRQVEALAEMLAYEHPLASDPLPG